MTASQNQGSDKESSPILSSTDDDSDKGEPPPPPDDSVVHVQHPHTVVFKCIGAVRDSQSQETLRIAKHKVHNGWTVPVRMRHEPTNIVDAQAVVFECKVEEKWERIGYVVSDILNEVHSAIDNNLLLDVKLKWVKYITDWTRSDPGYFAGIAVTKCGQWERKVVRYRSTR